MPIIFSCSCGKGYRARETAAGKRVRCSKCGSVIVVPQPEQHDEPARDENARRGSPEFVPTSQPSSASSEPVKRPSLPFSSASEERRRTKQDKATQLARQRYQNLPSERPSTNLLDYGYWLLLLTFVPLAFSLLKERKEDTLDRLVRSLEKSAPAKEEKPASKRKVAAKEKKAVPIASDEPTLPEGNLDELIARLPGGRIEGAFLPRQTFMHWLYALLTGGAFWTLSIVLFPGSRQALYLLAIGAFTATIGILLLLIAQWLAQWTQSRILVSGNMIILLLFWVAWAIGFSYRAAIDPELGLVPSFLGFTFGVGLCEEVCKVLPLLWHYRVKGPLPWRTACSWGFISGVGFGVSEGITYAADFYNGIASGDIYLVRFISCVALHGIWSASAALFIHKFRHIVQGEFVWYEFIPRAIFLVGIPMILHGLYDTFLKREMGVLALLTALASFAWFAWSMESARRAEESSQAAVAHA
jgi:protease PrsW